MFGATGYSEANVKHLLRDVRRGELCEAEDDNGWFFTERLEFYSLSRGFTKCFLHTKCHKWVHDHCSVFSDFRVCSNCYTDADIGDLAHAYVNDACNCIYFGHLRNFNKYASKKNFTF
jgi:hypothetical protein